MNPIYKFELSALGNTQRAYPIYKDDLSKEFEKESGQEFFRAKLSGKLTFERDDYAFIVSKAFDTQFTLDVYISYDASSSWALYWTGTFWKTDCDFDEDSQTVIVQPTVKDQYNDVLAGMDKEFNLIDLAPEMAIIKADKRPMVQVYIPGDSTVGCFLAGMSWEQECDVITDEQALVNTYNFALSASLAVAEVTGDASSPQIPAIFTKRYAASKFNPREMGTTEFTGTNYKLVYLYGGGSGGSLYSWTIIRVSDNTTLWQYRVQNQYPPELPYNVTLTPVSGSGASGNIELYVHNIPVYCRYVLDVETIMSRSTSPIPDDDIVENNRNYRRVIGYEFPDCIFFSTNRSSTPTKWGLYQPGEYYQKPPMEYYYGEFFPVSRREWGEVSVWFAFFAFDQQIEEAGRKAYTIKNNYPLWSVISVLLKQLTGGTETRTIPESEHAKTAIVLYSGNTTWQDVSSSTTVRGEMIPLRTGITYTLTFANGLGGYTVVLDSNPVAGATVHWAPGYSTLINTTQGQVVTIQGVTGQYLFVRADPVSNGRVFPVIQATSNGVKHEATIDYSEFLYSSVDPIAWTAQRLFLTPKSNILTADYDQPAQKAPITLRKVMEMLRDCFRLYWFIDDQNRFRIEHITWFMRGGTYSPSVDNIAHDLTQEIVPRNGKPWAFARSQYKFDKPAMAERYEFGWMDEVTYLFEGFPIDITSKYVTPGNIQQTKVDQFTSDIDYMLLNPGACSKDGFALLGAVQTNYITPESSPTTFGAGSYRDVSVTGWKAGETIKIVCNLLSQPASRPVVLSFYDANNTIISIIAQVLTGGSEYNISAVVPGGATKIRFTTNNVTGSVGVVMKAVYGEFAIPYGSVRTEYSDHVLQNFFCSFVFIENNYYVFDMPARYYSINGTAMVALGIKKLKTQDIRFPLLRDIDLTQLIKTTLGDGIIDKLSVNLSSRNANATLKYDTE